MKKIPLIICLLFSGLISSAYAEAVNPNHELADSLIWEITGPGITQPSYLAGTMHMLCEEDFKVDERFKRAIDNTSQLYLEIDMDDPNEMSTLMKGMVASKPLKERLSPAQYQQLETLLTQYTKFNIKLFDKTEFFAIQSAFLVAAAKCPIKMLDQELMSLAQASGRPVNGLESVEDQLTLFKLLGPDSTDEAPWSEKELAAMGLLDQAFQEMVDIYHSEDISNMHTYITDQFLQTELGETSIKAMLDERNIKWVKKMPAIIKETPVFFAVGAGHLAGEFGVINLLQQAGLTVKPVLK